jgi:hypothetical protein
MQVPATLAPLGTVYDAVIRRVDPSVGLLLELPGKKKNTSLAGFAHVSNIKDTVIKRLEKEYKTVRHSPHPSFHHASAGKFTLWNPPL